MTGPRPVYSAGGTGLGALGGNWVDIAGGWDQESYELTSYSSQPLSITLASQGPSGVTASTPAASASIPADGTAQVMVTLGNASTSSGSGTLTFTATTSNGVTATASAPLHFSGDLALNPYHTAWPQPFASSSQRAFPRSWRSTATRERSGSRAARPRRGTAPRRRTRWPSVSTSGHR